MYLKGYKLCMSLLHMIKIHTNKFVWVGRCAYMCVHRSFKKLPHALRGKQDKLSETLGIRHLKDHIHCNSPINHILKNKDKN